MWGAVKVNRNLSPLWNRRPFRLLRSLPTFFALAAFGFSRGHLGPVHVTATRPCLGRRRMEIERITVHALSQCQPSTICALTPFLGVGVTCFAGALVTVVDRVALASLPT